MHFKVLWLGPEGSLVQKVIPQGQGRVSMLSPAVPDAISQTDRHRQPPLPPLATPFRNGFLRECRGAEGAKEALYRGWASTPTLYV